MRKNILLFLAMLLSVSISAQNKDNRCLSPYNISCDSLAAMMRGLASHGFLTQFSYMDISFVQPRLSDFLENYAHYTPNDELVIGDAIVGDSRYITVPYKGISADNANRELLVKYRVFETDGYTLVWSVEISGHIDEVTSLYQTYWNFDLLTMIDDRLLLQDKIETSYYDRPARKATIRISSTSYKNENEFYEAVKGYK